MTHFHSIFLSTFHFIYPCNTPISSPSFSPLNFTLFNSIRQCALCILYNIKLGHGTSLINFNNSALFLCRIMVQNHHSAQLKRISSLLLLKCPKLINQEINRNTYQ